MCIIIISEGSARSSSQKLLLDYFGILGILPQSACMYLTYIMCTII